MERLEDPYSKQVQAAKSHPWDCDSCLYDSSELLSFKRQLDSAIASRTFSMPRQRPTPSSTRSSMMTRSLRKLLRSVFRKKPACGSSLRVDGCSEIGVYVVYSSNGEVLPKIPEVWETDIHCSGGVSPQIGSMLLKKSASERFNGVVVGVSCS